MSQNEKNLFQLLIQHIGHTFLQDHPEAPAIEKWKGSEIVSFQEDLFHKVKGKVSEKWFYTYIKNDANKLPRIDILNLLSSYCGYKNWNDFKAKNRQNIKENTISETPKKRSHLKWLYLLFPIALVFYLYIKTENNFHFCLVDEDKNEPISHLVDVKIFQKGQSPLYLKTDSSGCFTFQTKDNDVKFVVQSPYHKTDTIYRNIDAGKNPIIKLRTDDYALMLQYYTNGNTTDWSKRKKQLQHLIDDEAQIYQLFSQNVGIELYTKEEFISKLTIPTSSLKNIQILDKKYVDGKIIKLKFMVK